MRSGLFIFLAPLLLSCASSDYKNVQQTKGISQAATGKVTATPQVIANSSSIDTGDSIELNNGGVDAVNATASLSMNDENNHPPAIEDTMRITQPVTIQSVLEDSPPSTQKPVETSEVAKTEPVDEAIIEPITQHKAKEAIQDLQTPEKEMADVTPNKSTFDELTIMKEALATLSQEVELLKQKMSKQDVLNKLNNTVEEELVSCFLQTPYKTYSARGMKHLDTEKAVFKQCFEDKAIGCDAHRIECE